MSGAVVSIIFAGMAMGLFGMLAWVVVTAVNGRRDRATERLAVIEKALDHPGLDAATRRDLLQVLRRDQEPPAMMRSEWWIQAAFGLGWLTLVVAGGMALLHMMRVVYVPYATTLPICVTALAVMTLPGALSEFSRRTRAATTSRG